MDVDADLGVTEAREMYRQWSQKRRAAEAERDRFARIAAGLGKMMDGLVEMYPDLASAIPAPAVAASGAGQPKPPTPPARSTVGSATADEIVAVARRSDHWLTVRDVVGRLAAMHEVRADEWPEASIRRTLRKAAAEGLLERAQLDGRTTAYRGAREASTPENAESPASTGPSVMSAPSSGSGGEDHAQPEADLDHHHPDEGRDGDQDRGAPVVRVVF